MGQREDADTVIRAGQARMRRRRLVGGLAAAAVLCTLIAVVALVWRSSRVETVAAEPPTSLPTMVDALPITREEVAEVPVPGSGGTVLYAHLLPDGLPRMDSSASSVVIAWEEELPDDIIPGDTVVIAQDFVGRGLALSSMKVDPTTGIGVLVTPAAINEIEAIDGATTHRAEAVDIGQGYRVFVVPGLRPRPWMEDGPTVRAVR